MTDVKTYSSASNANRAGKRLIKKLGLVGTTYAESDNEQTHYCVIAVNTLTDEERGAIEGAGFVARSIEEEVEALIETPVDNVADADEADRAVAALEAQAQDELEQPDRADAFVAAFCDAGGQNKGGIAKALDHVAANWDGTRAEYMAGVDSMGLNRTTAGICWARSRRHLK